MRNEELAKLTRVGYPTPSGAILRRQKLARITVGDGALDVPLSKR